MSQRAKGKVSVRELGRRLDLSISTVSRALSGHPAISAATREKTLALAKELGYQPNKRLQRFFKTVHQANRSAAYLVAPVVHSKLAAQEPFYARIMWAVQTALRAHGWHMVLADAATDLVADGNLYAVAEGMADGVIAELYDPALVERLAAHTPVVLLNADLRCPNVDMVLPDVERAAREQMDYLVTLGHQRLACFRPPPASHWQDRRFWREYIEYGARLGLAIPAEYLETAAFGEGEHPRAIAGFLARVLRPDIAPTAILTSDVYAGELISQLGQRGLAVPGDVSLIGFDDDVHAQFCPIPLTTFRQDFEAMAQTAVELLRERLKDPHRPARVVEIAGKLIERTSTAPAPAQRRAESLVARA